MVQAYMEDIRDERMTKRIRLFHRNPHGLGPERLPALLLVGRGYSIPIPSSMPTRSLPDLQRET